MKTFPNRNNQTPEEALQTTVQSCPSQSHLHINSEWSACSYQPSWSGGAESSNKFLPGRAVETL